MTNLEELSKEELLQKIQELLQTRTSNPNKKGLYFTKKTDETVIKTLTSFIPMLRLDTTKSMILNANLVNNVLIKGDNLLALICLFQTYKNKIDIIYIDPPYNTGNHDFTYNDTFVDENDSFRDTKWLNFMYYRLVLASALLKEDGMICISIDNNEYANLKLLCDDIFGKSNFIEELIWITNPSGKTDAKFLAKKHEYVLIYAKNKNKIILNRSIPKLNGFNEIDEQGNVFKWDELSHILSYSPSMDYEIIAPDGTKIYAGYCNEDEHTKRLNNTKKRKDYVWRWSINRFNEAQAKGDILIKKNKEGVWRVYAKTYAPSDTIGKSAYSSFYDIQTASDGKEQLSKVILSKSSFSYPKPTGLIQYLINLKHGSKSMTILDFFAGSGTTGQAVMELNVINKTNHRFILCSNNENNNFDDVLYPRIKTLITGYRYDGSIYNEPFKDFIERAELRIENDKVKRKSEIKTYTYQPTDFQCNLIYYDVELKPWLQTKEANEQYWKNDQNLSCLKYNCFKHMDNHLASFQVFYNETESKILILKDDLLLKEDIILLDTFIQKNLNKKIYIITYYYGNKVPNLFNMYTHVTCVTLAKTYYESYLSAKNDYLEI